MKLGRVRSVHFVGIGGSGMCGIAEVLLNLGYRVSGSDLSASENLARLERLGAEVRSGHGRGRVGGADVVVVSTAIGADNPEVAEARELRIPVIPRAEMLGELMRMKYAVAVAGSHGKTSTTSMVATVLTAADLDPTVVIGGRLDILDSNAKLGRGEVLVAEADESDGSFLRLFPTLAVVTCIDREHLDHYGDMTAVRDAFVSFLEKVPFYGLVVACLDDAGVREVLPRLDRRVVTYGLDEGADYRATAVGVEGFSSRYTLHRPAGDPLAVRLCTPGLHQVRNSLAAIAVAEELGVPAERAVRELVAFPGADRRMQRRGEVAGVLVVDDYGHHPREIRVTLEALRTATLGRRLMVLFQPHRYSRLELLFDEFCECFGDCDELLLTDLYAAGEKPREGVHSLRLAQGVVAAGGPKAEYVGPLDKAIEAALDRLRPEDVVLTLGAGSIHRAAGEILAGLRRREEAR